MEFKLVSNPVKLLTDHMICLDNVIANDNVSPANPASILSKSHNINIPVINVNTDPNILNLTDNHLLTAFLKKNDLLLAFILQKFFESFIINKYSFHFIHLF